MLMSGSIVFAAEKKDEIYMDFSENGGSNMLKLNPADKFTYDVREGRRCAVISVGGDSTMELGFDISDDKIYDPKEKSVEITVEYYDEGTGYFTISYDSTNGTAIAEPVILENTKKWMSHTFRLYDAAMKNRYSGGCDFAVDINAGKYGTMRLPLLLGSVRAEKKKQRGAEVSVTSKRAGNIFVNGEDIDLDVKFTSCLYKKEEYTVSYTVKNRLTDDVVWTGEDSFELGAEKSVTRKVKYTPEQFGLFVLKTEVTSKNGTYSSIEESKFSYSMFNSDMPLNEEYGTCVHFTERDSAAVVPLMAMTGMKYARDGCDWDRYETSKGVFKFLPAWDRYVGDIKKSNLSPLMVLAGTNMLYQKRHSLPETPEELEAYGRYVYNIVSALGDRCNMYEVWNEPNLKSFSDDTSPEAYVPVLKVAYANVKKANPNAIVMGCATAGIDNEYFERVFEMGGADYMDILSYHYYFLDHKVMDDFVSLYDRLKKVDDLVEKYKPSLKMVITEYGWATNTNPTTRKLKSDNYLKTMAIYKKLPRLIQTYWYEFQDSGTDFIFRERNFGYVNYWENKDPYAAEQVYCSTAAYNSIINSSKLSDMYENGNTYVYKYGKNFRGNNSMMMWEENGASEISVKLGCKELTLYDDFGNGRTIYSDDGVFTFILGDTPIMAEGDMTEFEVCGSPLKLETEFNVPSGEETEFNPNLPDGYTIEYTPNEDINVIGSEGNTLKFSFSGENGKESRIHTEIKKDGKLYTAGDIIVKITASADAEIAYLPYLSSVSKAVIAVTVKNNRRDRAISGSVTMTEPKKITAKLPSVPFDNIEPQTSKKFYMYLPEFGGSGCFDFKAEIRINGIEPFTVKCKNDNSFAKRCTAPPKIDGVIEKDEYDDEYSLNTVTENVVNLFDNANQGEEDLLGKFYVTYDDKKIYIAAKITDDVHYQFEEPGMMWRGDGIQIGLADKTTSPHLKMEIGLSLKGTKIQTTGYTSEEFPMEAAIKRSGSQTIYEIALPWEGVFGKGWSIEGRTSIGFSALVNDNDGPDERSNQAGRKGWIEYGSGIGRAKDTNQYVDLQLKD